MHMPKSIFLYLSFLIVASPVTAQNTIRSNIQQYTTDNGLPSNGIKGMQWDERTGFLWLATEAGIVRFNGVDFKSYTKQNVPVLASERMLFMVKNNAGNIYTSDQSGNVFKIDKSNPVHWTYGDPMGEKGRDITHYYLLSVSDDFFLKKINKWDRYSYSVETTRLVNISDTAFIILRTPYLLYFSISSNKADTLVLGDISFVNIFKINENIFAVNDKKEISLLNINKHSPPNSSLISVNGSFLNIKASSLYWKPGMVNPIFISGNKAWLVSYNGNAADTTLICDNIPQDTYISWVQYSQVNNLLFIGTESKGLIVIHKNRVSSKKRNYLSKGRNSYYSQIELPDGNILTNEADIIGDSRTDSSNLPIKGKFAFNLSYTDENTIWFSQTIPGIGGCMHRYDRITGITTVYRKISGENLVVASSDNIYLANQNGIGILKDDSLIFVHKYPGTLPLGVIFDFAEINPGVLAIASCGGLLTYNTLSRRIDTVFKQSNMCVRSIWKYKDYVFFGTYGAGFYIYKRGVTKAMPLDKNNYLLYTHCFVSDDKGFCWISTNRGLFKANLAELIDAFENNRSSVYYHYYGRKDGMEMTELNGGCTPCALQLKNKIISFPSMDGLLWVDPDKAVPMLPGGDIFIDNILVNNEKINTDSISLKKFSSKTQDIIIELGYSAWCNKENIYIDYQLNDTLNWKAVSTQNEAVIRLTNLSSGNYVLRIRKLNGFGINNYTYKIIRFSISTPWHKQWWFYTLCMLALLGIIQLIFYIRTRQYKIRQRKLEKQVAEKTRELKEQNEILEKNDTIKTRLISIISHDIVTPLKFVTVAGKNLIEKRDKMPEELQVETIREMTNTSQELQLLSTNILNWIKYQNENRRLAKETFNLHELVNQVMGVLNSLAKQKGLILENKVDKGLGVYQFFEPLKILVYNLLTNAINFSEKGSIIINAEQKESTVMISVADEGVGMTADQIKNIMADQFIISSANIDNRKGNGLGYLIIKDLVKIMGATLHIESEKNKGTKISVKLPSVKPNTASSL